MKIEISEKTFHFKQPAGTSRGVYTERKSWIIELADGERTGIGECAPLPGLSCDDIPEYEKTLRALCDKFEQEGQIDYNLIRPYPSMLFGLETAVLSLLRSSGVKECRSVDDSLASNPSSLISHPSSIIYKLESRPHHRPYPLVLAVLAHRTSIGIFHSKKAV